MTGAPEDGADGEHDSLVGRAIAGKFVIERRLGAGDMGAVYRAQQTALDRAVAIKVMHGPFAADGVYAARFHREAKAASRLDHPNVIHVHDYGQETDGLLYIVMELLECRDLVAVLSEDSPLPLARIVDVFSQILSGLAGAHDAGVLHRDLKPANIMLLRRKGEDGEPIDVVKVCDFGIAKFFESADAPKASGPADRRKLTTGGLVVGTPEYMSPEQARGESYDVRSDVYAVGVMLYQALTRRLPFEGKSSVEIVFKAMNQDPQPLDSHGVTAAPALDPICLKAIARRPEDRYQSAREMRAALQAMTGAGAHPASRAAAAPKEEPAPSPPLASESTDVPVGRATKERARFRSGALLAVAAAVGAMVLLEDRHAPLPTAPANASPHGLTGDAIGDAAPRAPPAPSEGMPAPVPRSSLALTEPRPPRDTREVAIVVAPSPAEPPAPPLIERPPPSAEATLASTAPQSSHVAAPAPSVTVPAAVAQPSPAFDPRTARVELGTVKCNNAAVGSGSVSRTLAPLVGKLTACYRSALAAGATGAVGGSAVLHLESDDQGFVTLARMTGSAPAGAAQCIEELGRDVRLAVDTGNANVDVTLVFKPF